MARKLVNRHGTAINPTSPRLIAQVAKVLAPHGGSSFLTPDAADDPLTERLVKGGQIWSQRIVRARNARMNACHDVASQMMAQDPSRYRHVYGYALTDDDQMWRTHSWVHDQKNDRLLEPTPVSRNKYFGVGLTDHESAPFY